MSLCYSITLNPQLSELTAHKTHLKHFGRDETRHTNISANEDMCGS